MIDGTAKPTRAALLFAGLNDLDIQAIARADQTIPEVAAASIVAKVLRDTMMAAMPEAERYGYGQHSGYGTAKHAAALRQYGPGEQHRRSFKPVRNLLQSGMMSAWPTPTDRPG